MDPAGILMTAAGGGTAVAVDLRSRRVPNILTLGVAGIGLALAAMNVTRVTPAEAALGCAVGLVLMLPGHVIGGTGAGDVKLLAAFGTLLGPGRTAVAFVYTALAGGVLALVVAVGRRRTRTTVSRALTVMKPSVVAAIERPSEENRFAYAPAVAIGALAAALGL
jgi:prepilin peptidase CpaA